VEPETKKWVARATRRTGIVIAIIGLVWFCFIVLFGDVVFPGYELFLGWLGPIALLTGFALRQGGNYIERSIDPEKYDKEMEISELMYDPMWWGRGI